MMSLASTVEIQSFNQKRRTQFRAASLRYKIEVGTKQIVPHFVVLAFFSGGLGRCSHDHLDLEVYCDVALS